MITSIFLIAVSKTDTIGPLLRQQINFIRDKLQETDDTYIFYFKDYKEMCKHERNLRKCERNDLLDSAVCE